jgi:hypothetical protein
MIRNKTFTRKSGSSRKSIEENQERTRIEAEAFVNNELKEDNVISFSESALIMPGLISFIVCTTVWYKIEEGG